MFCAMLLCVCVCGCVCVYVCMCVCVVPPVNSFEFYSALYDYFKHYRYTEMVKYQFPA